MRLDEVLREKEIAAELLAMDLQKVFNSEAGQRVLAELRKICCYDEHGFVDDARKSDYLAGRRSVFAEIIKKLETKNGSTVQD